MAARRKNAGDDAVGGASQVGVVKHDVRGLATELKGDAFEVLGREHVDLASAFVTSSKGDAGDVWVHDQWLADFVAKASDDVKHTRWKTCFAEQVGQQEQGDGGVLGGLGDNGVARAQGRAEFPGGQQQRGVPGGNGADHADRLVADVVKHLGLVHGNHGTLDFVAQATVIVEILGDVANLTADFAAQFAVVAAFGLGQRIGMLFNQGAEFEHQHAAVAGGHFAPGARHGVGGGLDGAIHVGFTGARNECPGFA